MSLDYTYEIRRISSKHRTLSVVYHREGYDDVVRNHAPTDFAPVAIAELITRHPPIDVWANQDSAPVIDESLYEIGVAKPVTHTEPVALPDPVAAPDLPTEDPLAIQIGNITAMSAMEETGGVVWTDPLGDEWELETTVTIQNRLYGIRLAADNRARSDLDVCRINALDAFGEKTFTYRPTTNAEIVEWTDLIYEHVQRCMQAEANAVTKANAGDTTANFGEEFAALA